MLETQSGQRDTKLTTNEVMTLVSEELARAQAKFGSFNSPHEGWAILREEVDELWDEVKLQYDARTKERMQKEAVQVAAMAIRFILDVT